MYPFHGWSIVWCLADTALIGFSIGQRWSSLFALMVLLFVLTPQAQAQSGGQAGARPVMTPCSPGLQRASSSDSTTVCELPLDHDGVKESGFLLCHAEQVVERLIMRIRHQQNVIAQRRADLERLSLHDHGDSWSNRTRHAFSYVVAWFSHQLQSVTDYWRIGSLEGSLLIAYSKLGAARQVAGQQEFAGERPGAERLECQLLTDSSRSAMVVAEF